MSPAGHAHKHAKVPTYEWGYAGQQCFHEVAEEHRAQHQEPGKARRHVCSSSTAAGAAAAAVTLRNRPAQQGLFNVYLREFNKAGGRSKDEGEGEKSSNNPHFFQYVNKNSENCTESFLYEIDLNITDIFGRFLSAA